MKTLELSERAKKAMQETHEVRRPLPPLRFKSRSRLRRALDRGVKERNGETPMVTGKRFAGEMGPPHPDEEKLDRKMHGIRAPWSPDRDRTAAAKRASMASE